MTTTIDHDTVRPTAVVASTTPSGPAATDRRRSPRRLLGVVAEAQSYRNIAYLLLGLPLGTAWFTVLVTGVSVGVSMLAVALLGIPLLLAVGYLGRPFANVERWLAGALLGRRVPLRPLRPSHRGNPWVRLRTIAAERDRRRELVHLVLRFPVGVATFVAAVTALTTPLIVAYAPFGVRYDDDHTFGSWAWSGELDAFASSSWSWSLVPLGLAMLIGSFHLLNAMADACGRWTATALGATTPAG